MRRTDSTRWTSSDGKRRVTVWRDAKGCFLFEEEALELGGDAAEFGVAGIWTCVNASGLYATLEDAKAAAIAETRWLESLEVGRQR